VALSKHLRHGIVQADYESDSAHFFDCENIPAVKAAIDAQRARNWRHLARVIRTGYQAA